MGDLRNKARKQEEEARIRAMQRRLEGVKPGVPPPRCRCGKTAGEVEVMWAHQEDRWAPVWFYCPACLPKDLKPRL